MFKSFLLITLCISMFSIAEEDQNVGWIITNYYYDQSGRPYSYSTRTNYYYNSPYRGAYYNPYTPYYYSRDLPGADPDRFEDMYYQNLKR